MNHNHQTRQLLIQTANRHHQSQNRQNTRIISSLEKNQDMYLDISDLVDDKKWDRIIDALHSLPHESISYVAKKLIGRLLREKHFTDEVVSLLDHISSGCSLEMRIYQILEHNGSIDAMRYYLEKGAPSYIQKNMIPFPKEQFKYIIPVLSSIDTLPTGMTIQMYYGPVHSSLLCHVIDDDRRGGSDLVKKLEILLSLGADPNLQDNKTGRTPLMEWAKTFYFSWRKYENLLSVESLRVLLENGANPLIKDKEGKDLHFWIEKANSDRSLPEKYMEEIKLLLAKYH